MDARRVVLIAASHVQSGTVELVRDGAEAHLDALTRRFTDAPAFYGHVYPAEQRDRERRVVARVHAHRVTLDAIHR